MPALISYLPSSHFLLAECLSIDFSDDFDLRDCFVHFHGIHALLGITRNCVEWLALSVIFRACAGSRRLLGEKAQRRVPILDSYFSEVEEPDCGCDDGDDEADFFQLGGRLLAVGGEEARMNVLGGLARFVEANPGRGGRAGSVVWTGFGCLESEAEKIAGVRLLTATVGRVGPVGSAVACADSFVGSEEIEAVDAACEFFIALAEKQGSVFGEQSEEKLLEIGCNASFGLRSQIARLAARVVEGCSDEKLRELIQRGIMGYFLDFLESDGDHDQDAVLVAVLRIVRMLAENLPESAGFMDQMIRRTDVLRVLAENCWRLDSSIVARQILRVFEDCGYAIG
jgi:hypothetical protein